MNFKHFLNSKYMSYAAIIGAFAVTLNNAIIANIIWSITNTFFVFYFDRTEQKDLRNMYFVYMILAWIGVILYFT